MARPPEAWAKAVDDRLGERIAELRRAVGLSQHELAAAAGFTDRQVAAYERGDLQMSACHLWRLSSALDVSVDEFFRTMPSRITGLPLGAKRHPD